MTRQWIAAIVGVALSAAGTDVCLAEIVSFQQGSSNAFVTAYQGCDDNLLVATYPDGNDGAYHSNGVGSFPWGNRNNPVRVIMRWDLTAMAGRYSEIDSITLTLYDDSSRGTVTAYLYAINPANTGWVEGTRNDNSVESGSSCWNYKIHDTAAWAGVPGCGPVGDTGMPNADYDYVALASLYSERPTSGTVPPIYREFILNGHAGLTLKDLIDQWSGHQDANPGIIIKADAADEPTLGDRFAWGSAERANVSERPMLTIEYRPRAPTLFFIL